MCTIPTKKIFIRAISLMLTILMLMSCVPAVSFFALANTPNTASAGDLTFENSRYELNFNKDWKFMLGNDETAKLKSYDDSTWKDVDLPHDFSITQDFTIEGTEAEAGNLPGGTGWYRKTFNLSSVLEGRRIIINFDGAYNYAFVYVNGEFVGENRYGYNDFSFDITEYINFSDTTYNLIAVKVVNDIPSSRWYSGTGIYRDVTMSILKPVHVDQYGTQVVTPNLSTSSGSDGTVFTNVTVKNENAEAKSNVKVKTTVMNGSTVVGNAAEQTISVAANSTQTVALTNNGITLGANDLWSPSNPKLYKLRTEVYVDDILSDQYDTSFGYRWFDWNTSNGFSLNGVKTKLYGVCMHHDQGALGAVQERDAIARQITKLKELGVNAIRTSHNTPSTVFMQLCDEMGMMVMDEFFDGLDSPKNQNAYDFSAYFQTTISANNKILGKDANMKWYEFVVKQTVKRDRNSPSVVIWDMANEIRHGSDHTNFMSISQRVRELVTQYDSYTFGGQTYNNWRPLTQGNNQQNVMDVDEYMDVIGGNYFPDSWSSKYLTKPFVFTETTSALTTRGVYDRVYVTKNDSFGAPEDKLISTYDTHTVSWGTVASDTMKYVEMYDNFSGTFVWTGFDYIGEPTPWNVIVPNATTSTTPNSSYFGFIDTAGFNKDTAYLYRSVWQRDGSTTLHLMPGTWNESELYKDGSGYVNVAVYSNAKTINLYLNDVLIGTAVSNINTTSGGHQYKVWTESVSDSSKCKINSPLSTYNGNDLYSQFQVKYASGTLRVEAFDDNNNPITDTVGTKSVSTNTMSKVVAKVWNKTSTFTADGDSFAYVEFEAQDASGNFYNDYNGTITIQVTGEGTIAGVDNGNPATTKKFQQASALTGADGKTAEIEMLNGRALAIIKTTETPGDVNVTCTTPGYTTEGDTFYSAPEAGDELKDEFEELIPQTEHVYVPSVYDDYEALKSEYDSFAHVTQGNVYTYMPVSNTELIIPDGQYIISGSGNDTNRNGGPTTYGYLMHQTHPNGGGVLTSSSLVVDDAVPPSASTNVGLYNSYNNLSWLYDGVKPNNSATNYLWTSTAQAPGQYFQLDLGTEYVIDGVNIAAPNNNDSTCSAVVKVSTDGTTWDTVGNYNVTTADATSIVDKTINFTERSARYVRVEIVANSNYWWKISEIAVLRNGVTYDLLANTNSNASANTGASAATVNSDKWYITRLSNGKYNIYYYNNGTKYSLGITGGVLTLTDQNGTDQQLTVTYNSTNSTFIIGNGTVNINYSGGARDKAITWSEGTALTLQTVNNGALTSFTPSQQRIPNGTYILYNSQGRAMATSSPSQGKLNGIVVSDVNDTITVDPANEITFTYVSGREYYIQNAQGQYLTIGSTNGSLSFTDTPFLITAYPFGDGQVGFFKSSQVLDYYAGDDKVFSTWTLANITTGANANQKHKLYKKPIDSASPDQAELYTALGEALEIEPGAYSSSSYNKLLTAVRNGMSAYTTSGTTSQQYLDAAQAIRDAISLLEMSISKFPATIYKYGYNPSTKDYSSGGAVFNAQTLQKAKEYILGAPELVNQIKTLIDYDGTNGTQWTDEAQKNEAIDIVAAAYARLYTLHFSGSPMMRKEANGTFTALAEADPDHPYTAWNYWMKGNSKASTDPVGSKGEGASIQGLFSSTLSPDRIPTSHEPYSGVLSFFNDNSEGGTEGYNNTDKIASVRIESVSKTVTLTPLSNISVYIPDFFSKNDVLANNSTETYSKYYWDLNFPFSVVTDSYGVNEYAYDSSNPTYAFRASYDDANHSAVADLERVNEWSVHQKNLGDGRGFYPFNYQKSRNQTLSGEGAIYHFGMSFETSFYIPEGGKYTNGKDIVFNFSGDDDVLVYVDDTLVLDNGGIHGARACSINFTQQSVDYQFALDITDGTATAPATLISTTEDAVSYKYGATNEGISADNLAAITKLHEITSDGKAHTFKFFYLERGSTASNCKITFNLQKISDYLTVEDETLVLDYGMPVTYNANNNNVVHCSLCGKLLNPLPAGTSLEGDTCAHKNIDISYVGFLPEGNTPAKNIEFNKQPEGLIAIPDTGTITHKNTNGCGEFTISGNGTVTYRQNSMEMPKSDSIYLCLKVQNDSTYSTGTVYYTYEKFTVVPATTIYYEDNFDPLTGYSGIAYTNGSTPANYNNTTTQYGVWKTETDDTQATVAVEQAADLVGDYNSNEYGSDPGYENFSKFSNTSAHYVSVSKKNNPSSKYSGGTGGSWPTAQFTFAGTGFDVIGITNNKMGLFSVDVYSGSEVRTDSLVKSTVVDCFYGYSYGRIYVDAAGKPTTNPTATPCYLSLNGMLTTTPTYYSATNELTSEVHYKDISGTGYTTTPTYYAADGVTVTSTVTNNPAYSYAYAYNWTKDNNSTSDTLYQVPTMKIKNLTYGTYTVVITPTFTSAAGHSNTDANNVSYYDFCLDAIRVYDPAGTTDGATDETVKQSYLYDKEAYSNYFELKDMLIGADSLSVEANQGIIFIDGIASLNNDIEKYKQSGPNNELYLAPDQAVAFEIWATAVPEDVQIGTKTVSGSPKLMFTYGASSPEKEINTATDTFVSLNSMLPAENKIRWNQVLVNGVAYYKSDTIVLKNSSSVDGSILSITNLKWTFSVQGASGYFRLPTATISDEVLTVRSSAYTVRSAYKMLGMQSTIALGITENDVTVPENTEVVEGSQVNISVNSSTDVENIVIYDSQGNVVVPDSIESAVAVVDDKEVTQWNITLTVTESGTVVYNVVGEYADGRTTDGIPVTVEVTPETSEQVSILDKIKGFFKRIADFFKKLFEIFK